MSTTLERNYQMRLSLKLGIALAILTLSTMAFAGDVTIQFNNAGGNSWNGVSTYPYLGSVNGVPTDFMCVSYNEHITGGESWQANVLTIDQWGATLPGGVLEAQHIANFYLLQAKYSAPGYSFL